MEAFSMPQKSNKKEKQSSAMKTPKTKGLLGKKRNLTQSTASKSISEEAETFVSSNKKVFSDESRQIFCQLLSKTPSKKARLTSFYVKGKEYSFEISLKNKINSEISNLKTVFQNFERIMETFVSLDFQTKWDNLKSYYLEVHRQNLEFSFLERILFFDPFLYNIIPEKSGLFISQKRENDRSLRFNTNITQFQKDISFKKGGSVGLPKHELHLDKEKRENASEFLERKKNLVTESSSKKKENNIQSEFLSESMIEQLNFHSNSKKLSFEISNLSSEFNKISEESALKKEIRNNLISYFKRNKVKAEKGEKILNFLKNQGKSDKNILEIIKTIPEFKVKESNSFGLVIKLI